MRRWFNAALGIMVLALLVGGGLRPPARPDPARLEAGPNAGQRALPLSGTGLNGRPISLDDYKGQAVFVNFWATWCGPCRLEMPDIQKLQENLPPGTAILSVNATDTEITTLGLGGAEPTIRAVEQYMADHGYTFPVMLDPTGDLGFAYQVIAMPTSLFITPDGVIADRHPGPITYSTMRAGLKAALEGTVKAGAGAPGGTPLPEVISVRGFPLRASVLTLLGGLLLTFGWASLRLSRQGLAGGLAGDLLASAALGGLIGSKLPAVLAAPAATLSRPLLLLAQQGSPGEWAGGLIGAAAWAAYDLRREPRRLEVLDAMAAPVLAGMAVALLPRGWWHLVLLAGTSLMVALAGRRTGTPAHGQTALLAAVAGTAALTLAEFSVPGPTLAVGLSAAQVALVAAGLGAYGLAWRREHRLAAP